MISNKQFNSLVFTLIIISSIFYSPFIIYGVLHGIEAKIVPFFVSLIALYTQLILRFLLHLLDAKITYTPHNKDINGDN